MSSLLKHISNIIIATALISIFIGIFFFTYAAKVEQKIVQERSTIIIEDLIKVVKENVSDEDKKELQKQILPYLVVPESLKEEDAKVEQQNKALMKKALIFISVFASVCAVTVFLFSIIGKFSLKGLLGENLVILVFVALTEFTFLTFFAKNYITIDANFVKSKVVDTLIQFGNQHQ